MVGNRPDIDPQGPVAWAFLSKVSENTVVAFAKAWVDTGT